MRERDAIGQGDTSEYKVVARRVSDGHEHVYMICDRENALRLVHQLNERYEGIYEYRMEHE